MPLCKWPRDFELSVLYCESVYAYSFFPYIANFFTFVLIDFNLILLVL